MKHSDPGRVQANSRVQRYRYAAVFQAALERYSPGKILSAHTEVITGSPSPKHISSPVLLRLRGARAPALFSGFVNYRSLRVSPAMEAGLTDHFWELRELLHQ
jgi:hypothetical protein